MYVFLIKFAQYSISGFELTYYILQLEIDLRELAIRKHLKTNKIAIQKMCRKKVT